MDWKSKIFSLSLLVCLISCEDNFETGYTGKGDGSLRIIASSPSSYKQTRATDELDAFIDDTKFYLYATKTTANGEDWNVNYLLKNPSPDPTKQDALAVGVAKGSEKLGDAVRVTAYTNSAKPEYEELYSIASKFNEKPLNLYGIVAASNSQQEREALEAELSRSQYTFYRSDGKSAAVLMSHYAEDESGNEIATRKPLPDIMWSGSLKNLTPFENSGDIIMPFSHVLSKLRFHAIYIDDEIGDEHKIVVTGLRLLDYKKGLLNFANGLFDYNYDDSNTNLQRNEWIDITLPKDGVVPRDKQNLEQEESGSGSGNQLDQFRLPDPFAIARIFPTYNTSYDNKFDANLTDDEPGTPVGSLQDGAISDEHAVKIEITYTMNGENMRLTVPLQNVGKNFAFAPNHEYDIVLTFTTKSVVVAIEPMYYNYIDEWLPLDEYELGEPVDFGGVLWAAENLGATSANPTANAEAWERARGFYYQYGRNIPYYARGSVLDPYPDVATTSDGSTPLDNYALGWEYETARHLYKNGKDNIHIPNGPASNYNMNNPSELHGARAYPYIPILWEKEIEMASGSTQEEKEKNGYMSFLQKYRFYSAKTKNGHTDETKPSKNFSDPYIANYIVSGNYRPSSVAYTAYYYYGTSNTNEASLGGRYWNQKMDKPHPQNWYEIGQNGNSESDPSPKGWRLPTQEEFLSIFPYDHACGDISFNPDKEDATKMGRYDGLDGRPSGFNRNEVGYYRELIKLDYNDNPAVYVGIYRDGEGYNELAKEGVNGAKYTEGWGTVYAIKEQGTDGAYAIRWQIKIVGYDPKTKLQTETDINPVDPDVESIPYIGRGVLAISKYDLSGVDRDRLSLHYREPNTGEPEHTKGAEYKCIAFVDTDGDGEKDAGETTEYKIDWDNPDGVIYFPIPGYIIIPSSGGQALLYPGREALYWTADAGTHTHHSNYGGTSPAGVAVRIKYSGDYKSRFLYFSPSEYIANGCQIRCVRDTRADWN